MAATHAVLGRLLVRQARATLREAAKWNPLVARATASWLDEAERLSAGR